MPKSDSVEIETYEPKGPFGAKEAGEGLVSPTAPAIAEAIHHALGVRLTQLPLTPERILRALGRLPEEP
jgi:4-hydroxybenzoyl-CoA reductase subunit alpha